MTSWPLFSGRYFRPATLEREAWLIYISEIDAIQQS